MLSVMTTDNTRWYKNADKFIQIKPCEVKIHDILKDHKFDPNDCKVSKCGSKNCKTCGILITDNSFSSNLTKRSFSTHSFEDLSCKSDNVVYTIECTLCGLIHVGETNGELRKRMNGHRSQRTHNDFLWCFPISWNTISCNSFCFWLCF